MMYEIMMRHKLYIENHEEPLITCLNESNSDPRSMYPLPLVYFFIQGEGSGKGAAPERQWSGKRAGSIPRTADYNCLLI